MMPFLVIPLLAGEVQVDGGDGVRKRKMGGRLMLSARRQRKAFGGAWDLSGEVVGGELRVRVGRGYVNALQPVIAGVPVSGEMSDGSAANGGQPVLSKKGINGLVYACLKVTPNKYGVIAAASDGLAEEACLTVELVEGVSPKSQGASWYQPLGVFCQDGFLAQLAYFDYFYQAYKKAPTDKVWSHRLAVA